jgi:hypothetical protein
LKLDYYLKDYKKLKRRSYSLNFTFFFINVADSKNKELTIDINAEEFDIYNVFITINSFYIDEFYSIINIYNSRITKKKDKNDNLLEDLDYVFG